MKKILSIAIILLFSVASFGQWNNYKGVKVTAFAINQDTFLISNSQDGQLLGRVDGKWVNIANYYPDSTGQQVLDSIQKYAAFYVPYEGATTNLQMGANWIKAESFIVDTNANPSPVTGELYWNTDERTVSVKLADGGSFEIGEELGDYYHNLSGETLHEGDPVSVIGASGNRSAISRTDITDQQSACCFIGVVTVDSIPQNTVGRVTKNGKVRPLNTINYPESSLIYVNHPDSSTVWTLTPPSPKFFTCMIGVVQVTHAVNGVISLKVTTIPRLRELSDVNGTELETEGQIPVWNEPEGYFDFNYNINDYLTSEVDGSTTNELQDLSRTGNTLSLSLDASTVDLSDLVNPDLSGYRQKTDHDSLQNLDEKSYNSLTDKPTSLPASDVYAWAKAETKPTYTYSEVGAQPAGTYSTDIHSNIAALNAVSGTNTGDNAPNTTSNSYADGKVEDAIVDGHTSIAASGNALFDALALKAPSSGSANYVQVSPTSAQTGNIWISGYVDATSYKLSNTTLLLDAFKSGNAGAAGTIPYSQGSTSQLTYGTVNQVIGGNALTSGYVPYFNGTNLANTNAYFNGTNLGIGTILPLSLIDISQGTGMCITTGADNNAKTRTNSTLKVSRWGVPHFLNSEEPVLTLFAQSSSTENILQFGGGSSSGNTATKISFYTASNNTTLVGTEKVIITSNGIVAIGTSDLDGTPVVGKITIKGDSNDGASNIIAGRDSDEAVVYSVNTDGKIFSKAAEIGTSADNTTIEADGTIVMNGDATVFEDLNFAPNSSGGAAVTLPDYVTINNVVHREFTSANNQLCGDAQELPHKYKLSSVFAPHAHVFLKSGESVGTTGVTFTLYWELRQSTGTTSGSSTLTATSAQLANGNKVDVYDSTFAGAAELGSQLSVTIARTGGDAGDVILTTYGVHYEIDTNGSRTISTK